MRRILINEIYQHSYVKIPKELFKNPLYKKINSDAKVLYSLLLDRMELSKKNNWFNDAGEIYLIFTREHLMEYLNISKPTMTRAFNQLKKVNLIEEDRQGQGKPNLIYINHLEPESLEQSQKLKIFTSRSEKSLLQEVKNLYPSNTDISNTENQSVNHGAAQDERQTDEIKKIIENASVDYFTPETEELLKNCIEDLYKQGINGEPLEDVRKQLKNTSRDVIQLSVLKYQFAVEEKEEAGESLNNAYAYFKKIFYNSLKEVTIGRAFNA